jgi:hypothetical protein
MKTDNLYSKSLLALTIMKNNMVESIISLRVSPGIPPPGPPPWINHEGATERNSTETFVS